ncbi:hypothetical protein BpHYR1_047404 [Brachionus plicatilis]|uniref:Uncharacterized protein n=1 Tax=Brachionus plicatilis TaxID=10195 RepID=A0A3M7T624_BRAPC|nr:hypothetical protein BpHYR1_047404 [Brachionus plicatilis]
MQGASIELSKTRIFFSESHNSAPNWAHFLLILRSLKYGLVSKGVGCRSFPLFLIFVFLTPLILNLLFTAVNGNTQTGWNGT